jgi:hypothetical protein
MVIQLQKDTLGPSLQNIGTILGKALEQRGQNLLKNTLKQSELAEKRRADTFSKASKYAKQFNLDFLPPEEYEKIVRGAEKFQQQGLDVDNSLLQSFQASQAGTLDQILAGGIQGQAGELSSPVQAISEARAKPGAFHKGFESSISGRLAAITKGEGEESFLKRTQLDDEAGFVDRLLHSVGKFSADVPYYGAGAALGGSAGAAGGTLVAPGLGTAVGGTLGAGAGGFAVPRMLETALSEYQQHLDRGGKGTFEDFIISTDKVLREGGKAGIEGAVFSTLGKAIEPLKASSPAMKKLFEGSVGGKALENIAKSGMQASGLITAETIATQQLPTQAQIADTFTQVLGLNLMNFKAGTRKHVSEKVNKSKVTPEVFAENVRQTAQELGKDLTKEKDVLSIVNRVSKENPSVLNERASRTAQERIDTQVPSSQAGGPATIAEEQLRYIKGTPSVKLEAQTEAERVAERDRPKVKEQETLEKESSVRKSAERDLPEAQSNLTEVQRLFNETKDTLRAARKSGVSQEQLSKLELENQKLGVLKEEATERVKKLKNEFKSGRPYLTEKEIQQQAFQDVENIEEKAKTIKPGDVKENKLDELAKKIEGRRSIPGESKLPEDTQDRIHRNYLEQYERKIKELDDQMQNRMLSEEQLKELKKTRELAQKMAELHKGRLKVGRRRKGLQQMEQTAEKAEKFPSRVKKGTESQKIKSAREVFKKFDIPEETIEKAAIEAEREAVKETKNKDASDPKFTKVSLSPSGWATKLIQKGFKRFTGLDISPSAAKLLVTVVAPSVVFTPRAIAMWMVDLGRSLKMLPMDGREKAYYLQGLKNKGTTPKRLKRIEKNSKRILNEDTLQKLFG